MPTHLDETCDARVPDNGDDYRCGSINDVREGLCAEHRSWAILKLEKRIQSLTIELSACEQDLKRLRGEA